jgi:WD40 repeat protein
VSRATLKGHDDTIYCGVWSHSGSSFATTSKDRFMRIFDPRTTGGDIMVYMRSLLCHINTTDQLS